MGTFLKLKSTLSCSSLKEKFIFIYSLFLKKSEKFSLGNPYGGFPSNPVDISNRDRNKLLSIRDLVQTENRSELPRPE